MGGGFAKNATLTSANAEVRHCGSKTSAAMGGGFAKNATLTSANAEVGIAAARRAQRWVAVSPKTPPGFRQVPNPGQLCRPAPVPF
ncbi:hypothetical protein SR914_10760 [Comamonas testosteroni]|uniref:hypothetical protein n=1 Tax=Comamonas testosteroni TaxID=285 RepID=UPI0011468B08|nr:hypothetical protein [Comamonas testosteroni]WQG68857.1 hypothetical protein SR914_10760 [Comamonas testosteroni]